MCSTHSTMSPAATLRWAAGPRRAPSDATIRMFEMPALLLNTGLR